MQGYNGIQLAATQVYLAMQDMAFQQTKPCNLDRQPKLGKLYELQA